VDGINSAWLAVWVLSPDWLSRKSDFLRALRWNRRAGGMRAVPWLCFLYHGICLITEENHGKPQSGYPKGARLISAERDSFFDLAIAGDGLDWPDGSCHPWISRQATGSTLG